MKIEKGSDIFEQINNCLLTFYDKEILRDVTSQDCLDFVNTNNPKEIYDTFFKLDPMGTNSLQSDKPEEWKDIQNARKSAEDFLKSKVGSKFGENQKLLRESIESKRIFNPRVQMDILGVTLKPSISKNPFIEYTKRDPFSLILTRLVVEIIKGEEIARCEASDCGNFFVQSHQGKEQRYCSLTCRKREYMREYRKKKSQ